jgi:hypothetical protein
MDRLIINELLNNPSDYQFLLENSYLIKLLNRNPYNYKVFKRLVNDAKALNRYHKVNNIIDKISFVNELLNNVK